jgi:hypothetical protein
MKDRSRFTIWSVDQLDQLHGQFRRSEDCEAVHNNYFNPLATKETSPVMTLFGCSYRSGNSGSPVIGGRGLRAVLSKPVDQKIVDELTRQGLIIKPIKPVLHVTNLACAPTIFDEDATDADECSKDLTDASISRARAAMYNAPLIFQQAARRLEETLRVSNKFIRLGVKLVPNQHNQDVTYFPKCFQNIDQWVNEGPRDRNVLVNLSLPRVTFSRVLDIYGILRADEIAQEVSKVEFQFDKKYLRFAREATIYWKENGTSQTFESVSENCGSLL